MLQGRLLIISSPQSGAYLSPSVGSTAERKQADFKVTLWSHNDSLDTSGNMKLLWKFLLLAAMLAWYMLSSCVCVCVSVCRSQSGINSM